MDKSLEDHIKNVYLGESGKAYSKEIKKSIKESQFTEFEIAMNDASKVAISDLNSLNKPDSLRTVAQEEDK